MSTYVTLKDGETATVGAVSSPDNYTLQVSTTLGLTGYTGSQGSQGSHGYTGSQGQIGTVGYTGSTGYTGSKGFIGYTGSASIIQLTNMDGGGAAAAYDVGIAYVDGGFSSTRFAVADPTFSGGNRLTETNQYTLDGGGA